MIRGRTGIIFIVILLIFRGMSMNVSLNIMKPLISTDLGNLLFRSSHRMCSVKNDVLKNFVNFTGNTCVGVYF